MRHPLIKLTAAAFVAGLALGVGPANAMPRLSLDGVASQTAPVEKAHYYRYRNWGYYGGYYPYYRSYRPYWYYRPYYGYRYQPHYRHYGYRYHRRWW